MTLEEELGIIEKIEILAVGLPPSDLRGLAEDFEYQAERYCLERGGHLPDNDHCGRPEHRFCYQCGKSMPYAPLAGEAKADEATGCKPELPSGSLGSGSIFKRWWATIIGTILLIFMVACGDRPEYSSKSDIVCYSNGVEIFRADDVIVTYSGQNRHVHKKDGTDVIISGDCVVSNK